MVIENLARKRESMIADALSDAIELMDQYVADYGDSHYSDCLTEIENVRVAMVALKAFFDTPPFGEEKQKLEKLQQALRNLDLTELKAAIDQMG